KAAASGRGTTGSRAGRQSARRCPHPGPPPQAGEGAQEYSTCMGGGPRRTPHAWKGPSAPQAWEGGPGVLHMQEGIPKVLHMHGGVREVLHMHGRDPGSAPYEKGGPGVDHMHGGSPRWSACRGGVASAVPHMHGGGCPCAPPEWKPPLAMTRGRAAPAASRGRPIGAS